jgi:hypothetical protein
MLGGLAVCLLCSTEASAGKISAADYPLRVHVFMISEHFQYYYGSLTRSDGNGRANLYENSTPSAFDFDFRCNVRLMGSMGYETYMARWKKPGSTMELLIPDMGHPDKVDLCVLDVAMKGGMAYYKRAGITLEEPVASFKDWMVKHQYDPEHGLNQPINLSQGGPTVSEDAPSITPNQAAPPAQAPSQPQAPPPPQ